MPPAADARSRLARLADRLIRGHAEPGRLAAAVGLGVFIAFTPLYGLHAPIALALAWGLRLNVAAAVLATQIANPLFAPGLIALSAWVGSLMGAPAGLGEPPWYDPTAPRFWAAWLRGGLALGLVFGALCGGLTWMVAARAGRRRRHG